MTDGAPRYRPGPVTLAPRDEGPRRCEQAGLAGGRACERIAVATVHDNRGCKLLCIAHAQYRLTYTSFAFGPGCACGQLGLAKR